MDSDIILFMETFFSLLKTVSNQMRNSSQYFYLLCDFARLGVDEVRGALFVIALILTFTICFASETISAG